MDCCTLPGSSVHSLSPGKNTGVGCHSHLHGIFVTQGSNPGLSKYRQILYHLSQQEAPWPKRTKLKLSACHTTLTELALTSFHNLTFPPIPHQQHIKHSYQFFPQQPMALLAPISWSFYSLCLIWLGLIVSTFPKHIPNLLSTLFQVSTKKTSRALDKLTVSLLYVLITLSTLKYLKLL